MRLTPGLLPPFVGGQLEIQNLQEGFILRGTITNVVMKGAGNETVVEFTLESMMRGVGFPAVRDKWEGTEMTDFTASLSHYVVSVSTSDKIRLTCLADGETVTLHRADRP